MVKILILFCFKDEAFLDLLDTPTPANDVEEGEVEDVGPAQKETVDVDSDEM